MTKALECLGAQIAEKRTHGLNSTHLALVKLDDCTRAPQSLESVRIAGAFVKTSSISPTPTNSDSVGLSGQGLGL